jgi:hypothetical protein
MARLFRCWILRGIILMILAVLGYGGWFAAHWVSPEKVRTAVEAHLAAKFDSSVKVHLGEAHLRIFGGIALRDLTLTREGDSEPFLIVPEAVISHDKEQLSRGALVIRKIELERPRIHLVRQADGRWNYSGVMPPSSADQLVPTLVVNGGIVRLTDERPDGIPAVALLGAKLQLLNDPLHTLKIEGSATVISAQALQENGTAEPNTLAIPLQLNARLHRATGQIVARLQVPELELTPDFAPLVARYHPREACYLTQFSAKASVVLDLTTPSEVDKPIKYDVAVTLREGRFEDAQLPWAVEQLAGTIRLHDGTLTAEKLTAKFGHANVELNLRSKPGQFAPTSVATGPRVGPVIRALAIAELLRGPQVPPPILDFQGDPLRALESYLDRFDMSIAGLSLDDDLFERLTPKAKRLREIFNPRGGVNLSLRFHRTDAEGGWRREAELKPNKLSVEYEHFRYPVTDLTGSLKQVMASDGTDEFQVHMTGSLGGRRIDLSGKVAGEGPDPYIALRIAGTDIPVDEKLIKALPGKSSADLLKLRASARGDFVVDIRQNYQVNRAENTFQIRVYNGSVNYEHFPYPFQQVRGNVLIRTTVSDPNRPLRPGLPPGSAGEDRMRVELKNFEAIHDGGRFWLSGENDAVPGSKDRKMTLRIQGENCPVDKDFRAALAELKLAGAIRNFALKGDFTFGADVEIWDRFRESPSSPPALNLAGGATDPEIQPAAAKLPVEPPFNPNTDLRLTFNFKGPSITPAFFPYDMHQLAGLLRYHGGRLELVRMSARHGSTELKLDAGEVRFAETGEVWANLGGISLAPLHPDAAFLKALPAKLRNGFQELNLRGPTELMVKHLVIRTPPDAPSQIDATAPVPIIRGQAPELPATVSPPSGPVAPKMPQDPWRELGTPVVSPSSPVVAGVTGAPGPKGPTVELLRTMTEGRDQEPTIAPPPGVIPELKPESKQDPKLDTKSPGGISLPFSLPWQKPKPAPAKPPALPIPEAPGPVIYWNATLKLNGAALDLGMPCDDVYGTIASMGRHEGTHLGAVSGHAWFDKAVIARQPLTSAKLTYRVRPQVPDASRPGSYQPVAIEILDLAGSLFQGTLGGEGRVVLADAVRYRLWLTVSGVKLEDLARHYKIGDGAELRGLAQGQLLLENVPDSKTGKLVTIGSGQVDVPQGRMYNLPVLLELVKVLKGQAPDGCAFEEAHASFELKGDRIKVTQLDLLGSAVSLGGGGEMDTDGKNVKFEFYTIWSQTLKRWLSTPFGDVTGLLSGSLFKIELTRENGKLVPKAHMLPVVTDPVRAVAERLRNRTAPAEVPSRPATIRATSNR